MGHDTVLLVQVEREVETVAQLGEILQRTAQEGDVAADGTAARQTRDGLGHDGLEDGSGDVLGTSAFVEQRLYIGLGKNAAAAGDGIDGGGVGREFVKAAGVGVQQSGHLVDEGARAAGAGAVHALLDAVVEVDDLGVLAAQFDGNIGGRDEVSTARLLAMTSWTNSRSSHWDSSRPPEPVMAQVIWAVGSTVAAPSNKSRAQARTSVW